MKNTNTRNGLPQLASIAHSTRKDGPRMNLETASVMSRLNRLPTLVKRPGGWGGTEPGRWFDALGNTVVGGTCARCGQVARAIDLRMTPVKGGETRWMHRKGEC